MADILNEVKNAIYSKFAALFKTDTSGYESSTQTDDELALTDTSGYKSPTRTVMNDELALVVLLPNMHIVLGFQFVPENLKYGKSANFDSVGIIARNIPKYHFTGGSDAVLSFRLDFHAEQEDRQDVIDKCRAIEALTYTDGYDNPIPYVRLVWGNLYNDEIWVVQKVSYELQLFKPDFDFMPQQAYLDITLLRVAENNLNWGDIK